jgi:hypothetical protein
VHAHVFVIRLCFFSACKKDVVRFGRLLNDRDIIRLGTKSNFQLRFEVRVYDMCVDSCDIVYVLLG